VFFGSAVSGVVVAVAVAVDPHLAPPRSP
jgi:hypothetical protein